MSKHLLILDNKVHWIFDLEQWPVWDDEQFTVVDYPESGYQPVEGDAYVDGQFSPAIAAVAPIVTLIPQSVSWRQANLALLEIGKLGAVESLIESIADPIEKRKAQIEFNSPVYERASVFLQSKWAQLGGTEAGLDDLFILANTK